MPRGETSRLLREAGPVMCASPVNDSVYLTVTDTGSEARPFATTTMVEAPVSMPVDGMKVADTIAFPVATPIVLKFLVRP